MRDELGTLFHEAPAPTMGVDPAAVLAGGRRRRRRRRITAVAGTAAAALVLGAGGWAVLGQQAGPERSTLPATSATTSVPAVSARLLTTDDDWQGELPHGVDVSYEPGTHRVAYQWLSSPGPDDGVPAVITADTDVVSSRPDQVEYVPWRDGGMVVGVAPAGARQLVPVWAGPEPRYVSTASPLEGTDRQAFALWWDDPGTPLAGVLWPDGESVRNSVGAVVPSGRLNGTLVFADPAQDVFGIIDPEGFTTGSLQVPPASRPVRVFTVQPEGEPARTTYLMLLPSEAVETVLHPRPGVTSPVHALLGLGPTVGTALVAELVTPSGVPVEGTGMAEVVWKDAQGTEHAVPGAPPEG